MTFDIKTDLSIQYEYPSGTWNEIVADSYEVDIDRGITIEQSVFARPDVGTARISLMKKDLTDLLVGPAYKSNQNFRVRYKNNSGSWLNLFNGVIQNIAMRYLADAKKLQIDITANDLMKVILNTQLSSFSITGTSSSARSFRTVMGNLASAISAIDSRAVLTQWLSGASGSTQWAYSWVDVASGDLFTQFLDAELGWMWCTYDSNQIRYATRTDINTLQGQTWNSTNLTISNIHSNATYHVCMDSIDMTYDSDAIANKVKVTEGLNQVSSTVTNSTSVTQYGAQLAEFEVTFDYGGVSTRADWATQVANAASPRRIDQITVPALRRDGTISNVIGPDIANTIQVEFTDGTNTLQEIYLISRIGHTISADHWEVSLGLWRGI